MRIRAKITLLVVTLIAVVVGSVATEIYWLEQRRAQQEYDQRTDALMEGVLRIGRESLSGSDELMLLSYLKFLMTDYTDIELAVVTRSDHTSVLGADRSGLFYRTIRVTAPRAAAFLPKAAAAKAAPAVASSGVALPPGTIEIKLGFSTDALRRSVEQARRAILDKLARVAAIGLALGVLGSLWLAHVLAGPITELGEAARALEEGKLDVEVPEGGKDELGALARQFNRTAATLRDSIRFKEELLSTLSHELNTPLGGLKAFVDYLERRTPVGDRDTRQSFQTMGESVRQMEVALGNAIQLIRARAGWALKPERVDALALIDEAVRLFTPMARSNDIKLYGPAPAGKLFLTADRELLRRVIVNLISNAVKFTPPGGSVSVEAAIEKDWLRLRVGDTGPGIAAEDQPRIFERFYRAPGPDGKAQRIPGSGLGLAIVKRAVDLQGGRIALRSAPGQGSIFEVSLPKAEGVA